MPMLTFCHFCGRNINSVSKKINRVVWCSSWFQVEISITDLVLGDSSLGDFHWNIW